MIPRRLPTIREQETSKTISETIKSFKKTLNKIDEKKSCPKIPATELDEEGNPKCMIPDLDLSNIDGESKKWLPKEVFIDTIDPNFIKKQKNKGVK